MKPWVSTVDNPDRQFPGRPTGNATDRARTLSAFFSPRSDGLASAHPWPSYAVRDFPRLGFLLLNQSRHEALMQLRQLPSAFHREQTPSCWAARDRTISKRSLSSSPIRTLHISPSPWANPAIETPRPPAWRELLLFSEAAQLECSRAEPPGPRLLADRTEQPDFGTSFAACPSSAASF